MAENALILAQYLLRRNYSFCKNPITAAFSGKKQNRNFVSKLRFRFGGEGLCCSNLEFFIYIENKSDLFLRRGYKLEDLFSYNNLY